VRRVALVPVVGALLLLAGLGGAEARTYRLAWSYRTSAEVWRVSISSDGSYVAVGSFHEHISQLGGWVYLFSRGSSTPLWTYQTGGYVYSVSISSDGSYVSAGSSDGWVYLFSRYSGTPLWSYQIGDYVYSVSISSDGSYVAAGGYVVSGYGWVYLFSRYSGTPLWSYQTGDGVRSVSISSDGSYVAAGTSDGWVYLFSRYSGTPLWSYQTGGKVFSVSISSDGSYVAVGSADGCVYLFSRGSSIPLWNYQTGGIVYSVSISSDGSYVAAGSTYYNSQFGGWVYLFSRDSGTPLWTYQLGGTFSVSVSSDGSYVAAAGILDNRVYLFSRDSGTPLWSHRTDNWVLSVSISFDGSYVAAGDWDGRVYLFSLNNPPSLSYSLAPTSGTTRDIFTYEVTYSDPDGDAPAYVRVYVDGIGHDMGYVGGSYREGALYRYQTTLPAGSHTFYFEASDGLDTVRLPLSGTYSGPSVAVQPTSLSVSPSSFTLLTGRTQTLTATLTAGGTPLPGKTVSWSATAGSLSATSSTTDSSGRATVVFTAPSYATTVTITASFAGDDQYGGSSGSSQVTVRSEVRLVFTKPDGSPLAYTTIYYGTSEGEETALLGTTDGEGLITLPEWMPRNTWIYFRSEDGRYRGSSYVPLEGGTLSVKLTETGRALLPLVLVLVVGAGVACAVAWRKGLFKKPARIKSPGKPEGPFCSHCKLRLPPDARFCPECGREVKGTKPGKLPPESSVPSAGRS